MLCRSSRLAVFVLAAVLLVLGLMLGGAATSAAPNVAVSRTVSFNAGLTLFALPVEMDAFKASTLCSDIEGAGGAPQAIQRLVNGTWRSYPCGFPVGDFAIVPGQAYFVRAGQASSVLLVGSPIVEELPASIRLGWTGLGVPYNTGYGATDLCAQLQDQGAEIKQVSRWLNGSWRSYTCGFPIGNFSLAMDQGYLVRSSSAAELHLPYLPADGRAMQWSEDSSGALLLASRSVLLRWRGASLAETYTVSHREVGGSDWQPIGTVRAAQDPEEMRALLGEGLSDRLAYDLSDDPERPLDQEALYNKLMGDPGLAHLYAEQFYQVAQVIGDAWLVSDAAANELEYLVVADDGTTYGPLLVPASSAPPALNPRQLFPGPDELGRAGSARPDDAAERTGLTAAQGFLPYHGRVHLDWDLPEGGSDGSNPAGYRLPNIAGYHVYRRGPLSNGWELANPRKTLRRCEGLTFAADPSCFVLLKANEQAFDAGAQGLFEDDLLAAYPGADPADIFTEVEYQVCSVDLLGNELGCETTLAIVRELEPPAQANDLQVTIPADHSQVTLTLGYTATDELSGPVSLHISRSLTPTLEASGWQTISVIPNVDPARGTSQQVVDVPPQGLIHWYRVEVRDDAGNWSGPGAMAKAALYGRTPPPLPQPRYDSDECSANAMPLTLERLDPRIRQIVVYRAFRDAPYPDSRAWVLLERLRVTGQTVTIADPYVPPQDSDAYYRIEAWDGHGNVSPMIGYCTRLTTDNVPTAPQPPLITTQSDPDTGELTFTLLPGSRDAVAASSTMQVVTVGESGPTTTTVPADGSYSVNAQYGQAILVQQTSSNSNGSSSSQQVPVQFTNDFLDTGRQMTDLGPLPDARWASEESAEIFFPTLCPDEPVDNPACLPNYEVALYRQAEGSNWMQLSTVRALRDFAENQPLGGYFGAYYPVLTDTADIDATLGYTYTALAYSPHTFEVLGFWQPIRLDAKLVPSAPIALNAPLAPEPTLPAACTSYDGMTPTAAGLPATLWLHNDWRIEAGSYFHDGGGGCPVGLQQAQPDASDLYGRGSLSNGFGFSLPVQFYGIAINASSGQHIGGRIATTLGHAVSDGEMTTTFGLAEWLPGAANVTLLNALPSHLRVLDVASGAHSNRVVAVLANLDRFWGADALESSQIAIVDEGFPWQLHPVAPWRVGPTLLTSGQVSLVDRLGYSAPATVCVGGCTRPDNNVALLRALDMATLIEVDGRGLSGEFLTFDPIEYATSLPGAMVVYGSDAWLRVEASRIVSGVVNNAAVALPHDARGSAFEWIARPASAASDPTRSGRYAMLYLKEGLGYFESDFPMQSSYRTLHASATSGPLSIGADGHLIGALTLLGNVEWPQFRIPSAQGATLFAAAASFPDGATRLEPSAPMPAENAWLRQADPSSGGEFDPGLNLNADHEATADWLCFSPARFTDMGLDLYLRRTGMSEAVEIVTPGSTVRANRHGYSETPQSFEALFLDNLIQPDSTLFTSAFYLPYPSDVAFELVGERWGDNCPTAGSFASSAVQSYHRFWKFEAEASRWAYGPTTRYQAQNPELTWPTEEPAIFGLSGASATIAGMGPQDDPTKSLVLPLAVLEWLPDGDYGHMEIRPRMVDYVRVSGLQFAPREVRLSRFHSTLLDAGSLPDAYGFDADSSAQALPPSLTDGTDVVTGESLRNCVAREPEPGEGRGDGCGFIVLDGDGYTTPFGPITPHESAARRAAAPAAADDYAPTGQWPVLVNERSPVRLYANSGQPQVRWDWAAANEYLTFPIPVIFLGNDNGGVLAGLFKEAQLLPGGEIVRSDLGLVASAQFDWATGQFTEARFGLFFGPTASQAAFRALAMNRPLPSDDPNWPGIRPFAAWDDVEEDINKWAARFGYTTPVDSPASLAENIWPEWADRSFEAAYEILEPRYRADDSVLDFGITALESGAVLQEADTTLENGLGQVLFVVSPNDGFFVESIDFGARVKVDNGSGDPLLYADWLSLHYNRDGEFIIRGEGVEVALPGLDDATSDLVLVIGFSEGNERVEGGVLVKNLAFEPLTFPELGFAFGAGQYNDQPLFYLGVRGQAYWSNFDLSGALLFGSVYRESEALRLAGFGEVLDKLPEGEVYGGFYLAFGGTFPIIEQGCALNVGASGELEAWYFAALEGDGEAYGGRLVAAVDATALCIVSARGQLELSLEQLGNGGTSGTPAQTCNDPDGCLLFAGRFWIAVGVGWCEPKSWKRWESRWWGDSWCYCVGAFVEVSYMDPPDNWEYDIGIDWE